MPSKGLLFGASSILGYHLAKGFPGLLVPFVSPSQNYSHGWPELHLESLDWIQKTFTSYDIERLLYCHAVCDVPKCEANPDWAYEINVGHLKRVLRVLPEHIRLVYVSSDHVFGGDGVYNEKMAPCPISIYGNTRVEAEQLVLSREGSLVIRPGLAIGPSLTGRTGHVDWLRYRTTSNLPITIIEDEYRSVVWADSLAERVLQLAKSSIQGVRHIPATRAVSRVELANYLFEKMNLEGTFFTERRHQRPIPHLGRVELASRHDDAGSSPLCCVLDSLRPHQWYTSFSVHSSSHLSGP